MRYYFLNKCELLERSAKNTISAIAKEYAKTKSAKNEFNVLLVTNEKYKYKLPLGNLTEVSEEYLINDLGFKYEYDFLSLEQLCNLADHLNNKYATKHIRIK